jgi:hypothetical protein
MSKIIPGKADKAIELVERVACALEALAGATEDPDLRAHADRTGKLLDAGDCTSARTLQTLMASAHLARQILLRLRSEERIPVAHRPDIAAQDLELQRAIEEILLVLRPAQYAFLAERRTP